MATVIWDDDGSPPEGRVRVNGVAVDVYHRGHGWGPTRCPGHGQPCTIYCLAMQVEGRGNSLPRTQVLRCKVTGIERVVYVPRPEPGEVKP